MRVLLIIVAVVVLLVGGIGWYMASRLDDTLREAVEQFGPRLLGAPVRLEAVELSLLDGTGEIRGLDIENPPGFDGDHAIRVEHARIAIDPATLADPVIEVREIVIDGASILAEQAGLDAGGGNLQTLLGNLRRVTGSGAGGSGGGGGGPVSAAPAPAGGAAPDASDGPRLIVRRLAMINSTATLRATGLAETDLPIADLHLTDLGADQGGITTGELAERILQPLLASVASGVQGKLDASGFGALRERLEQRFGGAAAGALEKLRALGQPAPQ